MARQNDFDPTFSRYDRLVIKISTPQNCLIPEKGCIKDSLYDQMKILITRFHKETCKNSFTGNEGSLRRRARGPLLRKDWLRKVVFVGVSVASHC